MKEGQSEELRWKWSLVLCSLEFPLLAVVTTSVVLVTVF